MFEGITRIRKTNLCIGISPMWKIAVVFDFMGYRIYMTADGLIKEVGRIIQLAQPAPDGSTYCIEFGIEWSEIPRKIYECDSYHGDMWREIIKKAK